MPILDAIPVNVFIVGTSVLAGVILFLILWKIPDEEEVEDKAETPSEEKSTKKKAKK